MHPNEMKNRALIAAARAEMDGFTATAEALRILAEACAYVARDLDSQILSASKQSFADTTSERARPLEIIH